MADLGDGMIGDGGWKLPIRTLGQTGIRTTLLGFGTGTAGYNGFSNQTKLGFDRLVSMLEYGYDKGILYFDLAHQYGTHPHMAAALEHNGGSIPRDEVMIQTKLNLDQDWMDRVKAMDVGWTGGTKAEFSQWVIDSTLKELGIDYFDVVFLHHMGLDDWAGDWPRNPDFPSVAAVLERDKAKGKIRAIGATQHEHDALIASANFEWGDVNMARLNPWGGWGKKRRDIMDASVEEVLPLVKKMKDRGMGIIGMKIFNLANRHGPITDDYGNLREGFSEADRREMLAYACDNSLYGKEYAGLLDLFSIGFESEDQIDEVLQMMAELLPVEKPAEAQSPSV